MAFRDEAAHGVDSETGIAAQHEHDSDAHDVTEAHGLLHGGETQVWCMLGIRESTIGMRTWGVRWNGR